MILYKQVPQQLELQRDFGGDLVAWTDWLMASEMRRQAHVIERTGWTLDQYDAANRDRVDQLVEVWTMEAGLQRQAERFNG